MRTVLSWVAAFVEAVPPSSPPLLLGAVPCVEVGCRLCGVSFRSARSVWEITLLFFEGLRSLLPGYVYGTVCRLLAVLSIVYICLFLPCLVRHHAARLVIDSVGCHFGPARSVGQIPPIFFDALMSLLLSSRLGLCSVPDLRHITGHAVGSRADVPRASSRTFGNW